jgi:Tfp pilus assembly protein PilO
MNERLLDAQTRRFGRILHYAGLLATVACATANYSLLHAPIFKETSATDDRIQELTMSVQNAPLILSQHRSTSQRLASAKERIAKVKERVPTDASAGEFLNEVSRIAVQENLAIKDYQPGKPVSKEGYAQLEVTLMARGDFASICTFFDRVAGLNRLSKLQDLTLTATGDASDYPVKATLVIFFGLRGKDAQVTGEVKRG